MTPRGRRAFVLVSGALFGCSSAVLLYSKDPPRVSQRPPMVTATTSASAPPVPAKALALEQFAPFVAEPRFAQVAEALELESPASAADALESLRAAEPELDTPLVAFWLGRTWERAGDSTRALAACELGAGAGAPLADHASLCAARALIAAKRPSEALERLRRPGFSAATEPERRLLEARALGADGQLREAVAAFRAALGATSSPNERARVEPEAAEALLALVKSTPAPADARALIDEALSLARHAAAVFASQKTERARLAETERELLALLSPAEQKLKALPSLDDKLLAITALVEARDFSEAETEANAALLGLGASERFGKQACELRLLHGKALAGARRYAAAVDALAEARERCAAEAEIGARAFYLSGRYSVSDGRPSQALGFFAEVEKRFPKHSLADDARFQSALAEGERGVDARFTELLLSLPDDYPNGDMAAEGLFRLALRRMERPDWGAALGLLERSLTLVGDADRDRGLELAGRERFFRARALLALDKRAEGLAELERVIASFPLSYYMLEAYSWLDRLELGRAALALGKAETDSRVEPFHIAGRPELEQPGFARMMDLLRIGELDAAVRELDALGLRRDGVGSDILWGVALLYERAGFSKFSSDLTRRRLGEVSGRWPVGEWSRAWQIAFPRPYLDIVTREATRAEVDPALVYGVMREESVFDPSAVSAANAYGLMQLIVPTAKMAAKGTNLPFSPAALKRPRVNVALGCRELSRLKGLFGENPLLVIPAYNAGPGRASRWLKERPNLDFDLWVELIPYQETRRYTKRVLASRAVYGYLYQRDSAATRLTLPAKSGG